MSMSMSPRTGAPVVLTLAAVTGLVPFAADMHLASLPEIGNVFAEPEWLAQLTLTGFLLFLGVGQLVAGPITDAVGRRRPLLLGLGVFVLGSLLAAVAGSVEMLVAARVIQGIGGSLSVVVANSSVRDYARGDAATRLFAILVTVAGLAPVIAPALGGWVSSAWGWRAVFLVLAVFGVSVFVGAAVLLKESLPRASRVQLNLGEALRSYARLLTRPRFFWPLAGLAAMFMALFSYIGGAPYVYQGSAYGVSKAEFGTIFGITGIALLVGAAVANRLSRTVGGVALAKYGTLTAVVGVVLATTAALTDVPLWGLAAGLAILLIGIGLCEPAFMALCMDEADGHVGSAAALVGGAQFLLGGVVTVAAAGIGVYAWMVVLGILALAAFATTRRIRR